MGNYIKFEYKYIKEKEMLEKLSNLINEIPEDKKIMGEKLAEEIAFMHRTLKALREDIDQKGTLDKYANGSTKMSESLKGYNSTLKSYNATIKQFCDLLPKGEEKPLNAVMEFLKD